MEKSRKCVSIGRASISNGGDLAVAIAETVNGLKTENGRNSDIIMGVMNGLNIAAGLLEASKYDGEACARILSDAAKMINVAFDETEKELEEEI